MTLTNKPTALYIKNFRDVLRINAFAKTREADLSITLTDRNGSIADARSLLGMMSLTYTAPVLVYSSDLRCIELLSDALSQN